MIDKKAHCILCGKEYTYWKCVNRHYKKEHPDSNNPIRIKEIWDVMNEEAKSFIKLDKLVGSWIK